MIGGLGESQDIPQVGFVSEPRNSSWRDLSLKKIQASFDEIPKD
jgi:hypothetical protein